MAVEPLFVADMDTLKARLRFSGAANADALAILDQAVEDVRVSLYDDNEGLGNTLVNTLRAIPFVENATIANDLRRTRANNLEVAWVRLLLLRRMPTLFLDAAGISHEVWLDEPLARTPRAMLQREIDRLRQEVLEQVAKLKGDNDEQGASVIVFEPDPDDVIVPGESIQPLLWRSS